MSGSVLLVPSVAKMRLEGHGVVRYFKSLLPVPRVDYTADELFGVDGRNSSDRMLALEILDVYVRAFETRVDVAEDIDIACPSKVVEQFIGQLLPRALPAGGVNGSTGLHSLVDACTWLEDVGRNSLIVVKEIEAYVPDLPDAWRFGKGLYEDILLNFVKELEYLKSEISTKPQVQCAIEPEPFVIPLIHDGECKEGSCEQHARLDETDLDLKHENSMLHNSVQGFHLESRDKDLPLEQCSSQTGKYTKTIDIQNLVGLVGECELEDPPRLLECDPADFLLDKFHIRASIEQQKIQAASSSSNIFGCLSLLDENSVAEVVSAAPTHSVVNSVKVLLEIPEVLEDEFLDNFQDLKLGAYVCISLMKPNLVELDDLNLRDFDFQEFENLVVLPELTLQSARFHFLQVPSFILEHRARLTEDVFKALFRARALPSPTSASDWLYLDWHMSQVGRCNNFGCFHLQRRLIDSELSGRLQGDMVAGRKKTDLQLLGCLAEDILNWHDADTECVNTEYPSVKPRAPDTSSVLNCSSFLYTADKGEGIIYSDQSVLTDELRIVTKDQVPLAVSSPTSMDSVLSLMKQARQGVLPIDAKSMQAPETEGHQEGCQGNVNTRNQSQHLSPEDFPVLASSSTALTIPSPNPSFSSGVDAASSYIFQASNLGEPELLESRQTPACPPKEILQMTGFTSEPPMQPIFEESNPYESDLDDLIEISSGIRPHLIVVANIIQPNGPVLFQRRSSYQKILGLENEDLQVVERELMLPVDLILNPSTCLTIYTEEKLLGRTKIRSFDPEGFFSSVMDTIVDSHMKALSFSFQRWFMIFEGELAFTSAITNILNQIYISSAGSEMRVQGFISTNSMTTDSLVLRCIKKMWRMSKRAFDLPMPEDLSEVEICLANFPSLNPLSSHAILCLDVPIATFLSWSPEEQNSALQGFDVKSESLTLLNAQALYGKVNKSAHPENFSQHSWPAASEIVAPEVGSRASETFSYFPPASEITNCELEDGYVRESDDLPPKDGHGENPSPPGCPDSVFQTHSAEQDILSWNASKWPNDDDQASLLPLRAKDRTERPDFLEENFDFDNPVNVQSILQQWLRSRKDGGQNVKHSGAESEHYLDSFNVPNTQSTLSRLHLIKLPPLTEFADNGVLPGLDSPNRREATDERKRSISALEQFRHKRRASPASQFKSKKSKSAISSDRSRDEGPSTQLDLSLKIARKSCNKFNSPPGRSI